MTSHLVPISQDSGMLEPLLLESTVSLIVMWLSPENAYIWCGKSWAVVLSVVCHLGLGSGGTTAAAML